MAMDERRKYELTVKVFEVLYVVFGGKRKTHTEVTDRAKMLFPIVVAEDIAETDKEEIIFAAVTMFEREVGIKVYTPTIIDNDYDADLWLYRVKPTIAHSYFDRYKLYLRKEGFSFKVIEEDIAPEIIKNTLESKKRTQFLIIVAAFLIHGLGIYFDVMVLVEGFTVIMPSTE